MSKWEVVSPIWFNFDFKSMDIPPAMIDDYITSQINVHHDNFLVLTWSQLLCCCKSLRGMPFCLLIIDIFTCTLDIFTCTFKSINFI